MGPRAPGASRPLRTPSHPGQCNRALTPSEPSPVAVHFGEPRASGQQRRMIGCAGSARWWPGPDGTPRVAGRKGPSSHRFSPKPGRRPTPQLTPPGMSPPSHRPGAAASGSPPGRSSPQSPAEPGAHSVSRRITLSTTGGGLTVPPRCSLAPLWIGGSPLPSPRYQRQIRWGADRDATVSYPGGRVRWRTYSRQMLERDTEKGAVWR